MYVLWQTIYFNFILKINYHDDEEKRPKTTKV